MRIRNTLLPCLLTGVILTAGFAGMTLVRPYLPDYKNEIRSFPQADGQNYLLIESSDALEFYPWSEFHAQNSHFSSVQEHPAVMQDQNGGWSNCVELSQRLNYAASAFEMTADLRNSFRLAATIDFTHYFQTDAETESVLAFRDVTLPSISGADMMLSVAAQGTFVEFFHYAPAQSEPLSEEKRKELVPKLSEDLAVFAKIITAWYQSVEYEQGDYGEAFETDVVGALKNAELEEYNQLYGLVDALQLPSDFLETLLQKPDVFVYQDEILMAYESDNLARLILFYNPQMGAFSGYSLQPL